MAGQAATASRLSAWGTLVLFVVVFIAIFLGVHWIRDHLLPAFHPQTLREKAAYQICGSLALDWIELLGMLAILRWRGLTLADLGWRKRLVQLPQELADADGLVDVPRARRPVRRHHGGLLRGDDVPRLCDARG